MLGSGTAGSVRVVGGVLVGAEGVELAVEVDGPDDALQVEVEPCAGEVLVFAGGGWGREVDGEGGERVECAEVGAEAEEGASGRRDVRLRGVVMDRAAAGDPGVIEGAVVGARGAGELLDGVLQAEDLEVRPAEQEVVEDIAEEVAEVAEEVAGEDALVAVDGLPEGGA